MIYIQVFWEFFKTGLFAIGGGLATLPFLSKMAQNYGWFTQEDIGNMLAVSESTPGPIGVNMATYVGNTIGAANSGFLGGVTGGVLSTLSLVLPSYLVILAVYKLMNRFKENRYVQGAMGMLRPASVGMISAAVLGILETTLFHFDAFSFSNLSGSLLVPSMLLFVAIFAIYQKFQKLHPVLLLACGAAMGVILKL